MTATGVHTFRADGLLSKWGFNDGDAPVEVWDAWYDQVKAQRAAPRTSPAERSPRCDWHEDVLIPVARDLLAPAIAADVQVYTQSTSHNPIRVRTVDGDPVDTFRGEIPTAVEALFEAVEVTLPVDLLVRALVKEPVLAGLDRLSGLDLELVGAALCAGLSVDEVADAVGSGGLDGLRVLVALRQD